MKNKIAKTQEIRLVDIFVLGPFMVWAGATPSTLPTWARWALGISGAATIAYNADNYLKQEKRRAVRRK